MKKQLALLLTCLLVSMQAFADFCCDDGCDDYFNNCCNCFGFESVLAFDVGGGYRNDSLKWKRYPESTPGQVIQERWNNIGMGVVETNAAFLACEHYLFKFDFDYGWFSKSGHQTYKVFTDDVLVDSLKSRTRGNVYDLSGGIGYQFNFECYRVSLAPLAGYSYQYQKFKNTTYQDELFQLIDDMPKVPFHNTYSYRWKGPWVGCAFAYQPCCDVLVFFDYAFHWTRLRAKIDEHFLLGERPAHLKVSNGYGNEFIVGADYIFCDGWWLGVKYNYKNYWANKGNYHAAHDIDDSKVRKLTWVSYNITLDIGYNF